MEASRRWVCGGEVFWTERENWGARASGGVYGNELGSGEAGCVVDESGWRRRRRRAREWWVWPYGQEFVVLFSGLQFGFGFGFWV